MHVAYETESQKKECLKKVDAVVDQNQWQRVAKKISVKQLSTRANHDDKMITGCTYSC